MRFRSRNVQYQVGQFAHTGVGMMCKDSQAVEILQRDMRLFEETVKLVDACDPVALFDRQALAILADMIPMTASGEFFVGAGPPADPAVVSHGCYPCTGHNHKSRKKIKPRQGRQRMVVDEASRFARFALRKQSGTLRLHLPPFVLRIKSLDAMSFAAVPPVAGTDTYSSSRTPELL